MCDTSILNSFIRVNVYLNKHFIGTYDHSVTQD